MISPMRSAPSASPISAKVVLIEKVSAVVRVCGPKLAPPKLRIGPPGVSYSEPPGNSLSGVYDAALEGLRARSRP